jgi:RNA polymerase sigma-70 factor (ECF subfamily)
MGIFKNKYKKFSDEKLMGCIQRGGTSAFNELYNRYSKRLLFYFFRELGGDEEKAQDFLQDTFLKIVEKPDLFRTEKKFSTWIFTVAYNLCKNEYRRMEVREIVENDANIDEVSQSFQGEYHPAEQKVDQKIFEQALFDELKKLDDGHRSAFLLRYQQNFSIKEIAEILGCSQGTVKSRLFYTTQKLAAKLKAFNPYKTEVPTDEKTK